MTHNVQHICQFSNIQPSQIFWSKEFETLILSFHYNEAVLSAKKLSQNVNESLISYRLIEWKRKEYMFTNLQQKNSWPETSTSYNMHTGSQLFTSTIYLKNISPSFSLCSYYRHFSTSEELDSCSQWTSKSLIPTTAFINPCFRSFSLLSKSKIHHLVHDYFTLTIPLLLNSTYWYVPFFFM